MVNTIKFSEMIDAGDLSPGNITVGLSNGLNSKFSNPFPLLSPGSTGDRPVISPDIYYRLRFNTTSQSYEYYSPILNDWVSLSNSLSGVVSVQGTADQVFSNGTFGIPQDGPIVLTLPQDISILSFPEFVGIKLNAGVIRNFSNDISVRFGPTLAAINYPFLINSVSGDAVVFTAEGADPDISLSFRAVGDARISLETEAVLSPALSITSGFGSQHKTNFLFSNTPFERNVTLQDQDGTLAYLSDVMSAVQSVEGTQNQVFVNNTFNTPLSGILKLSLPQDIGIFSSPKFDSPIFNTPLLGTPASGILSNCTGLPLTTGVTGNLPVTNLNSGTGASSLTYWSGDGTWRTPAGTGTDTIQGTQFQVLVNGTFGVPASGTIVLTTPQNISPTSSPTFVSPIFTSPILGTPQSATLTNATGLPLTTGVTGNLPVTNLNSAIGASSTTYWSGSGVWSTPSGTVTPAALTKTDDTNITLTLGGNPATALLQATSLILGWNGTLSVIRGGTGLNSISQGDLLYGSATNVISTLGKDTNSTRYLSNQGTSNNPSWNQVNLANGVTGNLPVTNLNSGTGAASSTYWSGSGVWSIPTGTGVSSIFGQTNRITVSAGLTPVIDIAPNYVGQTSLTTLGTVTAGTWNATPIDLANFVSGNLSVTHLNSGSGANSTTFWRGDNTWAVPTNGITPSALTKIDDANVTLALGGFANLSLLQPVSMTLGWSGQLAITRGGTGINSATPYAVLCGGTTSTGPLQSVASVGPIGQVLTSNGPGFLPTFQSVPSSGIINPGLANQIAYYQSSGSNISGLTGANSSLLVTNSSGVPSMTSSLTNGQIIIGSTAGTPAPATITAGTNISIVNSANSISIGATGFAGLTSQVVTTTPQSMVPNKIYLTNGSLFPIVLNLPSSPSVGDIVGAVNINGGWIIQSSVAFTTLRIGNISGSTSISSALSGGDALLLIWMPNGLLGGLWNCLSAPQSSSLNIV